MTLRTIPVLSVVLLAAACAGSGPEPIPPPPSGGPAEYQPIEPFWTVDLVIENEALPEAWRMDRPRDVRADAAGNIYVCESERILVFSPQGQPLKMIGQTGDVPVELENVHYLIISDDGTITVKGGQFGFTFWIFSPDLLLLKKYDYREHPPYETLMQDRELRPDRPDRIVSWGAEERVYYLNASERAGGFTASQRDMLFYERIGECQLVADYPQEGFVATGNIGTRLDFLGHFLVDQLPGRRIVYSHPAVDRSRTAQGSFYTLHIRSLADGTERTIVQPYRPAPLDTTDVQRYRGYIARASDDRARRQWEDMYQAILHRIAGETEKVPLQHLVTDGKYIFAYTFQQVPEKGMLVDVFDADTGRFLSTTVAPADYSFNIRDGLAYSVGNWFQEESPNRITRYRINPAVYGK